MGSSIGAHTPWTEQQWCQGGGRSTRSRVCKAHTEVEGALEPRTELPPECETRRHVRYANSKGKNGIAVNTQSKVTQGKRKGRNQRTWGKRRGHSEGGKGRVLKTAQRGGEHEPMVKLQAPLPGREGALTQRIRRQFSGGSTFCPGGGPTRRGRQRRTCHTPQGQGQTDVPRSAADQPPPRRDQGATCRRPHRHGSRCW